VLHGEELKPWTLAAALELNLLSEEALQALCSKHPRESWKWTLHLWKVNGRLPREKDLRLLIHCIQPDAQEQKEFSGYLIRSWPEKVGFQVLEEMNRCLQAAEILGVPGIFQDRKESVFQALQACWVREGWKPGGFTSMPDRADHGSDPKQAYYAVELMRRFGVPEDIDIARVRAYLQSETLKHFLLESELPPYDILPSLALSNLEESLPLRPRTFLEILISERLLLASLLLVALCVYATWKAPKPVASIPAWRPYTNVARLVRSLQAAYLIIFLGALAFLGLALGNRVELPPETPFPQTFLLIAVMLTIGGLALSFLLPGKLLRQAKSSDAGNLRTILKSYETSKMFCLALCGGAASIWVYLFQFHSPWYLGGTAICLGAMFMRFPRIVEIETMLGKRAAEIDRELSER